MVKTTKTLCEDATFFLQQLHNYMLQKNLSPLERDKLENYDYSYFNLETFKALATERFTENEWFIFVKLFGLCGSPCETAGEIADFLNVTKQGVYALKNNGYRKLRWVWDLIFSPLPWDGSYKDYDNLGALPLSRRSYHYLARLGLSSVSDFKAIDEEFMKKHFSTRTVSASEILSLQRKLLNNE